MNNESKQTITKEQAHKIYQALDESDECKDKMPSQEVLDSFEPKAKCETTDNQIVGVKSDAVILDELSEDDMKKLGLKEDTIKSLSELPKQDVKVSAPSNADLEDTIKQIYGIKDDADVINLLDLLQKYSDKVDMNYYEALPKYLQQMADNMKALSKGASSSESCARMILDMMISDTQISLAMDEYKNDIKKTMEETNSEFVSMLNESRKSMKETIDKAVVDHPEKEEDLKALSQAIQDSKSFNKVYECAKKLNSKQLKKLVKRFNSECYYFNTKVRVHDIRLPKLESLVDMIKTLCNGFTTEQVKMFLVVMVKSIYEIDLEQDVIELAYVCNMVSAITDAYYSRTNLTEDSKTVISNLKSVIGEIIEISKIDGGAR